MEKDWFAITGMVEDLEINTRRLNKSLFDPPAPEQVDTEAMIDYVEDIINTANNLIDELE